MSVKLSKSKTGRLCTVNCSSLVMLEGASIDCSASSPWYMMATAELRVPGREGPERGVSCVAGTCSGEGAAGATY